MSEDENDLDKALNCFLKMITPKRCEDCDADCNKRGYTSYCVLVEKYHKKEVEKDVEIAHQIVIEFERVHGEGESRGACKIIAKMIASRINGNVVCGYIRMLQGDAQHWWVEKDNKIIDPLAEMWFDKPYIHIKI